MLGGADTLDFSNYTGTRAQIEPVIDALIADGFRWVYTGCQVEWIAREQSELLREKQVGLLGTYAYLYFGQHGFLGIDDIIDNEIQKAIRVAKDYGYPRVVSDVEASPPYEQAGITTADRIRETWQAVNEVAKAGLEPVIYTYGPYWENQMGNTREFSNLKLIHAGYWYDLHPTPKVNYGGWTDVWVSQIMSPGTECYCGPGGALAPAPKPGGLLADYNILVGEADDVTSAEFEDFLLAAFSGSEEESLPREQRLANARYRIAQRVSGAPDGTKANSIMDNAASALALATAPRDGGIAKLGEALLDFGIVAAKLADEMKNIGQSLRS